MVLRSRGLAGEIIGIGRGQANLDVALEMGLIDTATTDAAAGVKDADLVFIAVPVLKTVPVLKAIAAHVKPGGIVTDAGSVKGRIAEEAESLLPEGVRFVPGHPVAGTENSGAAASLPDLYEGRICILTPTDRTDTEALRAVRKIWEEAGSRVVDMPADVHDRVLAAVSHLPHMVAYNLVNTVADLDESGISALSYSAGGFRDFTRIASSSPEMWAEISAMNATEIITMIEAFEERLAQLKKAVREADTTALAGIFSRAKRVRDSLLD